MQPIARTAVSSSDVPVLPQRPEMDTRAAFQTPHDFIDVGHSRLAYFRFGKGPHLVFVHGWPLHSATFRGVIPVLAHHFTCHLFDLPGSGRTESADDAPMDFMSHAESLGRAVDALSLDRYGIVAHDSGGFIARVLAARDSRVSALVLGNTEVPNHVPAVIRLYAGIARLPGGTGLIRQLMRLELVRRSPLGFGGCFSDPSFLSGEFQQLFIQPILTSRRYAERQLGALKHLHAGGPDELEAVHRAIRIPVLLLWGDRDPFFPIDRARRMLSQFGGPAELQVLEGGKLFVHDERPEEFAERARRFLLDSV